jgi:tetratricopeptide (TPR) repeat protein
MGMAAEAIGYFEQAAQIDEDSIKYLMAVSDAWFQSGKNGQSLKYALKAAEKADDKATKAEILEKVANLYYSIGDAEHQRRTLEEIQKLK